VTAWLNNFHFHRKGLWADDWFYGQACQIGAVKDGIM